MNQNRLYHYLPSHPPPVHYSVYACADIELKRFTASHDFFRTVLFAAHIPNDELLAALIRQAAQAHAPQEHEYLVRAGREVASLLKDDYDRLTALLRRIRPEP